MHFCPRPSCRRAYHQSCLLAGKHKESSSTESPSTIHVKPPATPLRSARKHTSPLKKAGKRASMASPAYSSSSSSTVNRALRLLACSPDTDENVDLESLVALTMVPVLLTNNGDDVSDTEKPPPKRRRGRPSKTAPAESASGPPVEVRAQPVRALADTLADLPPLLLQVAQQPMLRGGAFKLGGVSGNIGFVTRARRLVYQILEGSLLPEGLAGASVWYAWRGEARRGECSCQNFWGTKANAACCMPKVPQCDLILRRCRYWVGGVLLCAFF